jgi:hypothetical protein
MTRRGGLEGQSFAKERPLNKRWFFIAIVASIAFFGTVSRASAEAFKSPNECVVGRHVADSAGKTSRVTSITDIGGCHVVMDATGKSDYYLFWMLHAAGGSAETNDKLVPGKYECIGNGRYTFIDMYITGPNTYSMSGTRGTFSVLPSRTIIFSGGVLAPYHAHLLRGPRIGLNTDGGTFYATTCEYNKHG